MQWEFAIELIRELKPLHVAIETSGYASPEVFRRVISVCDFVFLDIKLADREEHKKYTGVYNDKILENLKILKSSGVPFVLRTPLIPEITDTEENLAAIARLADGAPVELLPYNSLAPAKYPAVGRSFTDLITEKESRIKPGGELPPNFRLR